MVRFSVITAALFLAGCASTGYWRDLQIDGSSQVTINESIATIQQALPEWRRGGFDMILSDLWITGSLNAEAAGSEYTAREYFARLDGLSYEGVLNLAGPEATPRYWALVQSRQRRNASEARGLVMPNTNQQRFPAFDDRQARALAEIIR